MKNSSLRFVHGDIGILNFSQGHPKICPVDSDLSVRSGR